MNNENRIKEIRAVFIKKLELAKLLNKDEFMDFCVKLTSYLRYSRDTKIINLNDEQINTLLNNSVNFFQNIGFTKIDLISILNNNFPLLDAINESDFLDKYRMLSLAENDENTNRVSLIRRKPRLLRKSLNEIYARYMILNQTGREVTINSIIECNFNVFIDRFIRKYYVYDESKILNRKISLEDLIKMYPIDLSFVSKLKDNPLNEKVTFDNVKNLTPNEKRMLSIKNYKKVNNLSELSALLDISTSSLQRYLNEDSKKIVSEKEYLEIKKWLINAKRDGLKTGGNTSQALHGYSKDESGKFNGIKR